MWGISILIVIMGIVARLIPHDFNFAPIGAIAIFSGIYLSRRWSWTFPLVAMIASDAIIGVYDWRLMAFVYGSFLISVLIGKLIAKKKNLLTMGLGALVGSIQFFLITNAACVFLDVWYPHTWAGVMQSYTMALPFFKNSIISDLFYLAIFAGAFEFAKIFVSHLSFRKEKLRVIGVPSYPESRS